MHLNSMESLKSNLRPSILGKSFNLLESVLAHMIMRRTDS